MDATISVTPPPQRYNCRLLPPLDSDYLQFTPNNNLMRFMNMTMMEEKKRGSELSVDQARARAADFYTQSVKSGEYERSSLRGDQSLTLINDLIHEYRSEVGETEFRNLQIGFEELTSEQLLRIVNEQALHLKSSINDKVQRWTLVACIITTALTAVALFTTGPGAAVPAAANQASKSAIARFAAFIGSKISAFYALTIGKAFLAAEFIGDGYITVQELMNVWDESLSNELRADVAHWKSITKQMMRDKIGQNIPYTYVMKPSEMISLFTMWEKGDRSLIHPQLRNLIYGHPACFSGNSGVFSSVTHWINKAGNSVVEQIGTPSLFPAFALVLRVLSRAAAHKLTAPATIILNAGMWVLRGRQISEQDVF